MLDKTIKVLAYFGAFGIAVGHEFKFHVIAQILINIVEERAGDAASQ